MNLPVNYLKLKLSLQQLNSFSDYIREILLNYKSYSASFILDKITINIFEESLKTLLAKTVILSVNGYFTNKKKISVKVEYTERMALVYVTGIYPLPLDVNFIEYEIKNGLLK